MIVVSVDIIDDRDIDGVNDDTGKRDVGLKQAYRIMFDQWHTHHFRDTTEYTSHGHPLMMLFILLTNVINCAKQAKRWIVDHECDVDQLPIAIC
jgi:hypothetical protein